MLVAEEAVEIRGPETAGSKAYARSDAMGPNATRCTKEKDIKALL